MKLGLAAAAVAVIYALPALGQEAGECFPVERADEMLRQNGETIVASAPIDIGGVLVGMRFLVERANGTFKEVHLDALANEVCHVQDFIGDPRVPDARA